MTLLVGDYEMKAAEDSELFDAIRGMYVLDEARRNLGNVALGLPRGLAAALRPWLRGGQFGTVFDNSEDTLTFATFQTFDFQGLDELYEPVMEPLLFYILQRISQLVYDPARLATSKQLYADEVWKFLSNDRAREFLRVAGLTWRKWNGGIALITQSAESLRDTGMLGIINEICPQKLLLASPGADIAEYARMFKLNARETELFMALRPKRQFLLKTAHGSKVLNLTLDPVAFREYANAISLLNESAA